VDSTDASSRYHDALCRLAEHLAGTLAAEADAAALAAQFHVTPEDVRHCLAALAAVDNALGEDFPVAAGSHGDTCAELPVLPEDYEILGEIGRGGMGIVFMARQRSLDRTVAIKVLRPAELTFGKALQRFEREAKSLAKLRHGHIVAIHEVGRSGGNLFYIMDFVDGKPLAEILRKGPMTASGAVRVLKQVASAVAYAHNHGIIHRDLKPSNILIDSRGEAFVADFGLARDAAIQQDLTASGLLLGTPAYMSPEQARGDAALIGERTDIYALGAILYECLTGRRPFDKSSIVETIHAVIHREPSSPRYLNRRIPTDLEVICLKAMAKEPERRYGTVRAFLEDLERFEEGRPIRARRPTAAYRLSRWILRNRVPVAAAGATALIMAFGFWAVALPVTRGSPTTLQYFARLAHDQGRFEEAVSFYKSAIRGIPQERNNRSNPLAVELHRGWIESQRALIMELGLKNCFQEAALRNEEIAADAYAFYGPGYEDEIGDLHLSRARSWLKAGDYAKALDAFGALKVALEAPGSEPRLDALIAAASDEAHTDHQLAVNFANYMLFNVYNSRWEEFLARLCEKSPDSRAALRHVLLLALQRFLAGGGYQQEYFDQAQASARSWMEFQNTPDFEEPLADIAQMDGLSPELRALAVEFLSIAADLPLRSERRLLTEDAGERHNRPSPLPSINPQLEAEIVSSWKQFRAVSRKERYHGCVRWAVEKFLGPKDILRGASRYDLSTWLGAYTGLSRVDEAGVRAWWERHEKDDPVVYLSEQLGVSPQEDLLTVFNEFLRTDWLEHKKRRELLLKLLRLKAPTEVMAKVKGSNHAMVWYEVLRPPDEPYQLRIARIESPVMTGVPRVAWEQVRPLRIGETITIEWEAERKAYKYPRIGVKVPGVPDKIRTKDSYVAYLKYSARAEWFNGRVMVHARGGHTGYSIDPVSAELGFVMPAYSSGGGHDWRDPPARLFVVLETPGADSRSWSIDDWRARIAKDLAFYAAGLQERGIDYFTTRYLNAVNHLLHAIGDFLPLPGARRELAALGESCGAVTQSKLLKARLLAGDAAPVADPELRNALKEAFRDAKPEYCVRLLLATKVQGVRDLALSALETRWQRPFDAADLVEQAIAKEKITPSPALNQNLAQARAYGLAQDWWFTHPGILGVGAMVGLFIVYLLVAALLPLRPFARRYTPAAGLIVAGVIVAMFDYPWRDRDLLPTEAGYALMAAGALVFARGAGRSSFLLIPLGFVLALALALAAHGVANPAALQHTSGLAAAVSLSCLPFLFHRVVVKALGRAGVVAPRVLDYFHGRLGAFCILYMLPMGLYHLARLIALAFCVDLSDGFFAGNSVMIILLGTGAVVSLLAMVLFPLEKEIRRVLSA